MMNDDDPKYVILTDSGFALIFNPVMDHSEVACRENVVSAGFLKLKYDESAGIVVRPYGESKTLGIKSRGDEDVFWLEKALGLPV